MTAVATNNEFAVIEQLASAGALVFAGQPSLGRSLELAATVEQLRMELTPARLAKVKALMNTSLGFDTDRNPAKWAKPEPCVPYSDDVIRDVFIEASFRGFFPINNEFNIIAGRFYGGLNGFERLVKKHPKVTDFVEWFGIPEMKSEKGAIIKARANWIQGGVPQVLEREFAVRVNAGMGADAITGKARRKLYAAVYGRLSGVVTPDGEAGDDVADLKSANTAAPSEQLFGRRNAAATGTAAPSTSAPAPTAQVPAQPTAAAPTAQQTPGTPAPASQAPAEMTPKTELIHTLTSSGVSFDDFRDFVKINNLSRDFDSWASYDDLPEKVGEWFKKNPKKLAECIRTFGKLQKKD